MDEPVLAIDFGTSASSVILVTDDDASDHQLVDGEGRVWWESAVCWSNGRMWVGGEAKSRQANREYRYRNQFKRALRDTAPMVLGDREFTPAQLVTAVLGEMRRRAEKYAPEVRRAVLTVPPSYTELGDPRADLMAQAGIDAGFETVELLPEPVAAGLVAPDGQFPAGSRILVYDFGGGTFDAALVEVGAIGGDHRVPAVSIDRCGGTDIDASIARWLLDGGGPPELTARITADMRSGADPSGLADMMALAECCEGLKRKVDGDEPGVVPFRWEIELELPAKVLRELARPWVEMTIRCCRDLLRGEGVPARSLAGILLVGGSSQLPMVREELAHEFGRPVVTAPDPQLAVVKGAATFGRRSAGRVRGELARAAAERPVRWRIPGDAGPSGGSHPGGTGRLLRWRVDPGDAYAEGAILAEVQLPIGSIYQLRADKPGIVRTLHASPGQLVRGGDWLLTAGLPARQWIAGKGVTDAVGVARVTPTVHRGLVFTGSMDGVVEARVAATGELCWRRFVDAEVTTPVTVAGATLYVGCADGGLYALATETGVPVNLVTVSGVPVARPLCNVRKAVHTAPVVAGLAVFFGSDDGRLHVAIRPGGHASPSVQVQDWQPEEGARPFSGAITGYGGGIREPLVLSDGVVYAAIGGSLYAARLDQRGYGLSVSRITVQAPPGTGIAHFTVAGGAIYASCGDNVLRAFAVPDGRRLASFPPESGEQAPEALTARMGAVVRKAATRPRPLFSTPPVLASGPGGVRVLYAGTSIGRVWALDTATLAQLDLADVAASEITGLTVAGGTLYAGSADGSLCAVGTADPGLPERWRFHAGSALPVAPAVAEGSVFITTDSGHLHALDAVAGPDTPVRNYQDA